MEKTVTLEEALELVKQLSPVDKVRLIERIVPDIERELEEAKPQPRKSLLGLWADLGPAPSEEEIDQARREEWGNFSVSRSEVTSISAIGFWLLVDDREYFVPFADYPTFQDATVAQIYNVQRLDPQQFYWPDLDIDIELNALRHPEQFPLQFEPA